VAAQLGKRVKDGGLTPRETQVMCTLTTGKSNKEIGSALDISESTVKVHVTHILEKLNVTGRTEAINVALKRGLVHMDQPETA
jgi:DNA-binding NarL/FixJ family response regulator